MVLPALAAAIAAARVQPAIPLRPDAVDVPVAHGDVVDWFSTQVDEHADVIARDEAVAVARFAGRAGPFTYRTVEVVELTTDGVRFEHLRGPFAACEEWFDLRPVGSTTVIEHRGHFRMQYGVAGWIFGLLAVRPAFEQHVAHRLRSMPALIRTGPDR